MAATTWIGEASAPGPELLSPSDAVRVMERSIGGRRREGVTVLLCDNDGRVVTAVVLDGREATRHIERVIDTVLLGAEGGDIDALVVGVHHGRRSPEPDHEQLEQAVAGLVACRHTDIVLRDVIFMGRDGFHSLADIAGPPRDDHGDQ